MDKKTEELRDIFTDVADSDTVTETQEPSHGSLVVETAVDDRLRELIAEMRDRYEFTTELDDAALCRMVKAVYDGYDDADIADELGVDSETILRARLDLHLVRSEDTDVPFDYDAFHHRVIVDDCTDDATLAMEFDIDQSVANRTRRVVQTQDESRRANNRYRDEFASLLDDADISGSLTAGATEDGLDGATEGMETDVSF